MPNLRIVAVLLVLAGCESSSMQLPLFWTPGSATASQRFDMAKRSESFRKLRPEFSDLGRADWRPSATQQKLLDASARLALQVRLEVAFAHSSRV